MASTLTKANKLADEFTKAWRGELDAVGAIYDQAQESVGKIDDMADQFGAEFDSFRETYTPYRDMLLEMAGADGARRTELANTFMSLARPDYAGEGNRAIAGVAHQSANARDQINRTMTRGGGNPSSSNYQQAIRLNAMDEAKNKVLAATAARNSEKDRVSALTLAGVKEFDPTKSVNAASAIDLGAITLLDGKAKALTTATGARTNIAAGRANDITNPLASAAGTFQGISLTNGIAQDQADKEAAIAAAAKPRQAVMKGGPGWSPFTGTYE